MIRKLGRRLLEGLFRIRFRLMLVNALIVAVPLMGVSFARFYEREMLRSLEQDMVHQAQLLRQCLSADPHGLELKTRGAMLAAAARNTRTRIRLLGPQGELLADSHEDGPPEGPEYPAPSLLNENRVPDPPIKEHPAPVDVSSRPEVQKALAGQYGSTTRFWENRDRLYLFTALPILKNEHVEGVVYVTRSTNPVRSAMYRLRSKIFLILAASLAATMVLSLFLASTISKPLSHLTKVAEKIAAGDRSQHLKLRRRDEIGQLARAFDAMTKKLDERAQYIGQLAANISHEFKSPLTSIRGAAELLIDGAADDPQARDRFLNNILTDAHRLDRLVTRLLELSRFEADPVPSEVLDYEALVRESAQHCVGEHEVKVVYHASRTHLLGKRAHLSSVLINLLDNAQQHAEDDTEIEIRVSDGPQGRIRTSVHNKGPAISEANLTRIWDRFFTTRADCGGTGLGLPIVATVVEAHGGQVSVQSTPEDGTTFTFDLPAQV